MSIRQEESIGKYTVGGTAGGDAETLETWENVISQVYSITHQGILNLTTADNLLAVRVYVVFRSQYPDPATVKAAMAKLEEYKTDDSQLVKWPAYDCD